MIIKMRAEYTTDAFVLGERNANTLTIINLLFKMIQETGISI